MAHTSLSRDVRQPRVAKPAISCVGNGGQPGPSEQTDPTCASNLRERLLLELERNIRQ
jgi:hypothetical protein